MNEEIILNVEQGQPYGVGARAYVEQTEDGAVITIIDKDGTTTATVNNGADGVGISSVTLNGDYTLTINYSDGTSVTTTSIRGETGASGVYCGTEEPLDPAIEVWVDPSGGDAEDGSVLRLKEEDEWKPIPSIVGEAAGFGTVTATVDTNVGTPTVVVTSSGEDTAKNFAFQFKNLGYDDSDLQSDFSDLSDDFDVLQGQFDTAVAAVTTDTEVTDIRVGADGVTDTTAGASVRRQFTDVKSAIGKTPITQTITTGKYAHTDDGVIYDSVSYAIIEASLSYHKKIHIVTHMYSTSGICFYDSDGAFVSSIKNMSSADTYLYDAVVDVPDNAVKIIVSSFSSLRTDVIIESTVEQDIVGLSNVINKTSDNLDGKVDKNGEKQVTSKNADFMFYSPNLFDISARTDGYLVNQASGELNANAAHSVSDWVSVKALTNYTFSHDSTGDLRYCFYKADKTFISGVLSAQTKIISITTPANTAWMRFSGAIATMTQSNLQFEKGSVATKYSPYGEAYLLPQYAPQDDAILNLPSKIYALAGYELNIYFENIIEDWRKYDWDISCTEGQQLERGFRITPTNADAGTYDLLIIARDGYKTISKKVSLIITASTAGSGANKSIIVLGDSTTANGIAVTKLNENFSNDVMSIETLGTRGTTPNKHEGRAGWTFNNYFTSAGSGDTLNPFYNPESETFDAEYYFANSGVSVPDWFFINLGINDMFSYTTDSALETAIETVKGLCDDMIDSILTAEPTIKIGLCLTIPPNSSQDAFGKAYENGQTRDRYKRNNLLWVNSMIAEYDGRESENLYLVPIYTNLDTVWNMGMESIPVNARNTITYESPIGNGGVHPAESGYWQIADVYTAFLKAQA